MKILTKSLLMTVAAGVFSSFSITAAAIVSEPVPSCLAGDINSVCIQEAQYDGDDGVLEGAVQYTISNNSDDRVFAFAVTNILEKGFAYDQHDGWDSRYYSKSEWDNGRSLAFYTVPEGSESSELALHWRTGDEDQPQFDSHLGDVDEYLGSFESLFGTAEIDNGVSIFWNGGLDNDSLINGVTLSNNYLLESNPFSEAVALGATGNTLVTSAAATAPVPEPETYAMFLAGLGLLGFTARRRNV